VAGRKDPRAESEGGVLSWEPEASSHGLNLYHSDGGKAALLIDMKGDLVHRWLPPRIDDDDRPFGFHVSLALRDGSLLAVSQDRAIFKLDSRSRLLWSHRSPVHHSVSLTQDGRILTLSHRRVQRRLGDHKLDYLDDLILVLDGEGAPLREVSLLELVEGSVLARFLPALSEAEVAELLSQEQVLDPLHANEVAFVPDRWEPPLQSGVLVSLRNLNVVALLDPQLERVVWFWGPNHLYMQHHPTLLDNGHLLIFDNGTSGSRVIELDPSAQRIVWSYSREGFFSETRGSSQRLPNGNTLVVESNSGYVREITADGETVWHFANPDVEDGLRRAIYRMTRYPEGYFVTDFAP
jgi:outer membrane protein assembly factor BamB